MAVQETASGKDTPKIKRESPAADAGDRSRLLRLALGAAILLLLILAERVFVATPDDAYITFRYARNLAGGYGPVFNPGAPPELRTEGYSCPLFMALMAVVFKLPLGIDLLFRAKLLGLACAIGTLILVQKIAARLGMPVWARAALPLLVAAHSSTVVAGVNGMETMPMTFLVTLATYLFLADWNQEAENGEMGKRGNEETHPLTLSPSQPSGWWRYRAAWAFAACALMRPEGILFGIGASLLRVGRYRKEARFELRWLLTFLLPVIAFLLWRHAYYGLWLPNTFYAKNIGLADGVDGGGKYLLKTFFKSVTDSPLFLAAAAGWWALVLAGIASARFQRLPGLIVTVMAGAQVVFVLKAGGDGMGGWRFMASVAPLLMLLSVGGIVEIANGLAKPLGGKLAQGVAGALCGGVLAACLAGSVNYWRYPQEGYSAWAGKGFTLDPRALMRGWLLDMTLPISDWLNQHVPPRSVIAYTEMGVTPYYSPHIHFLDANGLTDHGIATLPGAVHAGNGVVDYYTTMKGVVGPYLLEVRKPDYIMIGTHLPVGEQVPPISILDDAYAFHAAIPLPPRAPNTQSFMLLWKRAR